MKKGIILAALTVIILAFLTGCTTAKAFKLWLPEWFDLERVADHLYVDAEMPDKNRVDLMNAMAVARNRVEEHFGEVTAVPDIIACFSEACYRRLGGFTSRAKTFGGAKILLSPRGVTAPIIAHEWSHAELWERLGGYLGVRRVPNWFDEGLAVVVSKEPTHSEKAWNYLVEKNIPRPSLDELTTREDWLSAVTQYGIAKGHTNPEAPRVVYATAGHEVRHWFRNAEREGLLRLIILLNQDVPFEKAYSSVHASP